MTNSVLPADITALLKPVLDIRDKIQMLQQSSVDLDEQQDYLAQIQQSVADLVAQVYALINSPQEVLSVSDSTVVDTPQDLKNVRALIIDDDVMCRDGLSKQLQTFGLQCHEVGTAESLVVLRTAEQEQRPYQIVVIRAQLFDHHAAYLARTIKATPQLSHLMLVLALYTPLMNFEKESAYFSGFACVLNLQKPERLLSKLANSWRGWSTKTNFTRVTPQIPQRQNCILLVEDDPIPQHVTQLQLTELGYEVDVANDGQTALKLLEQKQYSLVFMDIGLPDISGLDVTAEFRKRENGARHTPVIGLTMFAMQSDQMVGLQAGMDGYLVKPLMPESLRDILKRWCGEKDIGAGVG